MTEKQWKKNEETEIFIDDMGTDGEGIGHADGYTLFVKGALPGERVRVKMMKIKKRMGYARLMEILEPSDMRCEPVCEIATPCGGCTLQHMSYEGQLACKERRVKDCLIRIGGVDLSKVEWLPILGMTEENNANKLPLYYRNKAQFPVRRGVDGLPIAGFFAGRSHRLVPVEECVIQHPVINEVLACVMDFLRREKISAYDEVAHEGLVRHVFIRRAYATGQFVVCLVLNGKKLPREERLIEALKKIDGFTSFYLSENTKRTNVILGDKMELRAGDEFIEDRIGDVKYRISPQSFYQVNPVQTKKLYETALDFADLQGDETVWDLYCGIGSISLFLARAVPNGQVIGVEIVPEAVENARENARRNGIDNAIFYVGAAEAVAPKLTEKTGADVVVVDPPRKGCDAKLLDAMVTMAPERIVYVSCDPATLARDVKVLSKNGYRVERCRAVDMFPMGGHVETVVQLVNIGVKPDYTVRLEVDVDEFYKTVGEEKRHFVKPGQKNKKDK